MSPGWGAGMPSPLRLSREGASPCCCEDRGSTVPAAPGLRSVLKNMRWTRASALSGTSESLAWAFFFVIPSAADVLISWVPFMRDKQAGGWLRPAELEVTGPKCNSTLLLVL